MDGKLGPSLPTSPAFSPGHKSPYLSPTTEVSQVQQAAVSNSITWLSASFVHMTAIIGAGVMSIPFAYQELGLFFSIAWTIFCGVYCWANSYLLYELKLFYISRGEGANTFGELAESCSNNPMFGLFVDVITAFYMLFAATYYFFHMAVTIQFFFHTSWNVCIYVASAIGIAILFPFFQIQQVYDIVAVAIVASFTICGVIILCVTYAVVHANNDPQLSYGPNDSFVSVFNGMSIITQSFSGSYLLMEIISAMGDPIEFSWSLYLTFGTIFVCFTICGMVGYTQQGIKITPYFLDVLKENTVPRYIGSVLYVTHLIGAITILVQSVLNSIFARCGHKDRSVKVDAIQWLGSSLVVAGAMFLIANTIPWIDVFGNFVGSLFGMSFSFILPTLFYLISPVERSQTKEILLKMCLLLGCILWVWATVESLMEISQHWAGVALPFSCLCTSTECQLEPGLYKSDSLIPKKY